MTSETRVLLLVADLPLADHVRALAAAREGTGPPLVVTMAEGPVVAAVARAQGTTQGTPLGAIVRTHEEVVAAIEAGADEACVGAGLDLPAVVAFVDRVLLRAKRRRAIDNAQAAVRHGEKLAALGTLVAGVAHEINNPLTVVVMLSQAMRATVEPLLLAQGSPKGPDLRTLFEDVEAALESIREIVRGLRVYARGDDDEKVEAVQIPGLVDQVVRVVGKGIATDAAFEIDCQRELFPLLLPRGKITQVLTNLLINAAQAVRQVERPVHRIRVSARCDDEALLLSVSDTGPGISPENVERIFDPFFTTKRLDDGLGGSGLGLSISRSILQSLGGDLVAESVHGQGATFIAILPIEGRRAPRESRPASDPGESGPSGARPSLLIVEDDERLLRSLAFALRGRYDVLLAGDGQEAIDLLTSGSTPDAVLCDVSTPLVDGPALHAWIATNRPALERRLVFMTAGAQDREAERAAKTGRPLLEKPLTRERVLAALRSVR